MSDLDDVQLAPISVHKDAWNQKDLLEGIVQRYVTVRSHVGGLWPTWEIESDQLDENFIELNAYLERLGWMARLRRGDVIQLTTLPLPHRQFRSRIHLYMWTASIITLLLSAVRWMDSGRPESGWFTESVYLDGLVGFALPILGTLLLASFVQTRVSAKFEYVVAISSRFQILQFSCGCFLVCQLPISFGHLASFSFQPCLAWTHVLGRSSLISVDFRVSSHCDAAFRIHVLDPRIVVDIRSIHVVKRTISRKSTVPHRTYQLRF